MRIVFYSTNSNVFDDKTFKITVMPSNAKAFQEFCAAHPEDEFFCVTQKPGMFLPEDSAGSQEIETGAALKNIRYLPLETDKDTARKRRRDKGRHTYNRRIPLRMGSRQGEREKEASQNARPRRQRHASGGARGNL